MIKVLILIISCFLIAAIIIRIDYYWNFKRLNKRKEGK